MAIIDRREQIGAGANLPTIAVRRAKVVVWALFLSRRSAAQMAIAVLGRARRQRRHHDRRAPQNAIRKREFDVAATALGEVCATCLRPTRNTIAPATTTAAPIPNRTPESTRPF